jgi:[glutamine synthetase] adenylyltransferase / [glutamine synthetase]-adenylyl-L-tyrosine phosphorylase
MLNIELVPDALKPFAEKVWKDYLDAEKRENLSSLESVIEKSPLAPLFQREESISDFSNQLTKVFIGSEFFAQSVARYPQLFQSLISSGRLFSSSDYAQWLNAFHKTGREITSEVELDKFLRYSRREQQMVTIWQDLNRLQTMQQITADLSAFADAAITLAAEWHYRDLQKRYGTPIGRVSGLAQPFMVLGMGKLGAQELNISSDIDLIFTFPESGDTDHPVSSISNQEFFIKLGQKVIKSLDAINADGFVFRVDMRLRPHGQSGSLAMSFVGMEDYYETQGRDWERYAMIKARLVAWADSDQKPALDIETARTELRQILRPFTYRQYIDFSVIESLRDMKGLIARQVQRKGMNADVKLGEGGIREVEFIVQVFQLIRGGRDSRLQERQVCKLLPLLEAENYLPPGTSNILLGAYVFLRNTEHAIQAFQDKQTQALPADPLNQLRLAWVLGFADWESFFAQLQSHREAVNKEFRAVISTPEEEQQVNATELLFWLSLWDGSLQGEEAHQQLIERDVDSGAELLKHLQFLRESRAVMSMQASSRSRLDSFVPLLLLTLADESQTGEIALSVADTFGRILPLIESVARRTAYLVLLVENRIALQQLVRLCAASSLIAEQLTRYPALLDELLTPESLYAPPDKELLRDELRRDVLRLDWEDLEGHMEALRYFRSAHSLRVAASEVAGALPLMKVSDYLTYIAETLLEHVLDLAWHYMVARHGYPKREDGSLVEQAEFIIVGYGKLGGIELGHGSDLDLVFIHNAFANGYSSGEKELDNLSFYTRMGQRIIHVLNTQTLSGKLYEVDMRLRPSGNSGLLVSSLTAFEKYQQQEAWTWEHQALVRARVVAGDAKLAEAFEQVRQNILRKPRDEEKLRKDVVDMRHKMRDQLGSASQSRQKGVALFNVKQDAGGIVDIEFMVQYAALAWAHQWPGIIRYTDNIRILESLETAGLLDADSVAQLIAAYKAYRSTGHRLALQRQDAVLEGDDQFSTERQQVNAIWQRLMAVQ